MVKTGFLLAAGVVVIIAIFFLTTKPQPPNTVPQTEETTLVSQEAGVPSPQGDDIIRSFFEIIDEGRPSDAISMMSQKLIGDESSKQAWGVQFNDMETVKVLNIEKTSLENVYKVSLEVTVNPDAVNAPIPYYGWEGGSNIRFITLSKNAQGVWKIDAIATGP